MIGVYCHYQRTEWHRFGWLKFDSLLIWSKVNKFDCDRMCLWLRCIFDSIRSRSRSDKCREKRMISAIITHSVSYKLTPKRRVFSWQVNWRFTFAEIPKEKGHKTTRLRIIRILVGLFHKFNSIAAALNTRIATISNFILFTVHRFALQPASASVHIKWMESVKCGASHKITIPLVCCSRSDTTQILCSVSTAIV